MPFKNLKQKFNNKPWYPCFDFITFIILHFFSFIIRLSVRDIDNDRIPGSAVKGFDQILILPYS